MDGVLIDSMPYHQESFDKALKPYGLCLGDLDVSGRKTIDIFEEIQRSNKDIELPIKQLIDFKQAIARKLIEEAGDLILMPHTKEVLKKISANAKFGICTSGSRKSLEHLLRLLPGNINFNVLLTSEDVTLSKPNPEIYSLGASKLGLNPQQILVVEDSLSGISSGLAANCNVAAIGQLDLSEFGNHQNVCLIESLVDLV